MVIFKHSHVFILIGHQAYLPAELEILAATVSNCSFKDGVEAGSARLLIVIVSTDQNRDLPHLDFIITNLVFFSLIIRSLREALKLFVRYQVWILLSAEKARLQMRH